MTTYHLPLSTYYLSRTTHNPSLTTYHVRITTHCLLITSHYSLLTTYYRHDYQTHPVSCHIIPPRLTPPQHPITPQLTYNRVVPSHASHLISPNITGMGSHDSLHTDYLLPNTYYLPLNTYYLLFTDCVLRTTHYNLLTAAHDTHHSFSSQQAPPRPTQIT